MPSHVVCGRAVEAGPPPIETDPDLIARVLEDAAHYPGGHAAGLVRPRDAGEVAATVALGRRLLPIGAQSSLTGGATPMGDLVLSTERLTTIEHGEGRVRAGAGVTLQALQDALAARGVWFPPVPTYLGATVGGAVSTNAAGAATFKYGSTRDWVEALTVVLPDGSLLAIARGEAAASPEGRFEIRTPSRTIVVDVPDIRMPDVPKRSAGYHAAPGMDLVDLFVGAEGTLGVIVDATLRVEPGPAARCWALVPVPSEDAAIACVDALRRASRETWRTRDPRGLDVAAIEHMDRRSLQLVEEDGVLARLDLRLPGGTEVVLLVELELPAEAAARDLWNDVAVARAADAPDTPLVRLCRLLDRHGLLDDTELALPDQARRRAAFAELREAVPAAVNRRVARAKAAADSRISKTAADAIVPVDRFADMMRACRRLFAERDLDLAVWGHISDGNVHPNLIPRTFEDVERGRDALLALGRAVIAMGGCPLAEHGVGRNPLKQRLLAELYGEAGVEAMRRVKCAIDPDARLAPGVLFPGGTGTVTSKT